MTKAIELSQLGNVLTVAEGTGNVGINRTDPDQKLNVSGNIELNAYDNAGGSGGYYTAKGLIIGNAYDAGITGLTDDRNGIIWQERGLDLDFATNDTLRIKITYDGKVGIGTDDPVGNLEVRDTKANLIVAKDGLTVKSNSDLHTSYDMLQIGAGGALASYSVETATADTQLIHNAYRHSGGNWKYRYADTAMRLRMNSPGGAFIFESAANGSADGDITFSEKLRITSAGKVGIGNVDPANALHIKHDSPTIRLESSASSYIGRNTIGQYQSVLYIECDNDNAIANSATVFSVDGSEELRINSDGQLIHGGVSNPAGYDLVTGGSGYRSILLGSTTGATAAIIIDGAEDGDGSGSDYASIEHNTNGEMRYKNRQNSGSGGAGHVFYTTNADTERLRITSTGKILLAGADTTLAHANADDLIIGNTSSGTRTGITLVSANNQDAGLYFSDGTSTGNANIQGQIVYNHADSSLKFYTAATSAVTIKNGGHTDFTGYVDFIRPANDSYSYAGFGPGGTNAKAAFIRRGSEIDLEMWSNYSGSPKISINSDGSIFGSSVNLQSSGTSSWFQTGTSIGSYPYVWAAKNSSSNTWHSGLQTDGDLYLGGNLAGTNNIALNGSNGSAWFSGGVGIGGNASANTMDRYEEGAYTPKLYLGTGTTEAAYNWRYGQYVRIGEVVHVWGAMGLSGSVSSLSTAYIGNLPYNQLYDSNNFFFYTQLFGYTWASGYGDSGNTTRLFLQSYNGDGTKVLIVNGSNKTTITHTMIGNGQRFTFQFSYVVG